MAGVSGPKPKPQDLPAQPGEAQAAAQAVGTNPYAELQGIDLSALDAAAPQQTAGTDQEIPQQQMTAAPIEQPVEQPMESAEPDPTGWQSVKEQVREAGTRLRNAFTVTNPESIAVLEQSGMFEKVIPASDGSVLVKRPGRQGFERFDRKSWELIGDTLDFARDGFEAIAESALRGSAAVLGGRTAGVPGTVAGATLSGAASAIASKNAGDWMAQSVLEIPRDPKRSMLAENAMAGAMGAGFGWGGGLWARRAARNKAAQESAQKTIEFARTQVRKAMDDIAEVQRAGMGDIKLDPQQMVGKGEIPNLDDTAKELSREGAFQNARRNIADSVSGAYDSVASLFKSKTHGANIADDVILTANDVRNFEGKMLGVYREQAAAQMKGQPMPAPNLVNYWQTVGTDIMKPGRSPKTIIAHIQSTYGLPDAQARTLAAEVAKLQAFMQKSGGVIELSEVLNHDKRLTQMINNNMKTEAGRALNFAKGGLVDLRNALKEDGLMMTEKSFEAMGDKKGVLLNNYKTAVAKYKSIMDDTRGLGSLLEKENMSRNELLGKLFEQQGSYKFAQSTKNLINETNPGLWDSLAGEYLNKLRGDATSKLTGKVNWSQMYTKWSGMDPRLQQEILESSGLKPESMNALMRLGLRVQGADFKALAKDKALPGVVKKLFIFGRGLKSGEAGGAAQGSAVGDLLRNMGKDQAMGKWLADGGIEDILKEMPGLKPDKAQQLREWAMNFMPNPPANEQLRKLADFTGKSAANVPKTMVRRRSEEAAAE